MYIYIYIVLHSNKYVILIWGFECDFTNYNFRNIERTTKEMLLERPLLEGWNSRVFLETQGVFESIVKIPYVLLSFAQKD